MKILSLQNNNLTKIENLNKLTELDELYLSENGITIIENLEDIVNLGTLDLSVNKIAKIENIFHIQNLKELWVRIICIIQVLISDETLIIIIS